MRQTRWAAPGGPTYTFEYHSGALRVVVVAGRTLLVGMYCSGEGFQRVDLRDASTGEVVDVHGFGDKEWWHDPAGHFTCFTARGGTFVLHITGRPRGYRVLRVTRDGFEVVGHVVPGLLGDDMFVEAVAPAVFCGRSAILALGFDGSSRTVASFRAAWDGDRVLGCWNIPRGWKCSRLVAAGERTYAWLRPRPPDATSPEEPWRVTVEHGCLLWDVTSDRPVGRPLPVPGPDHGIWDLNGRPVALFGADRQVWDPARREPLGPGLGDVDLANPRVGTMRGRPVIAGTTQQSLRVWDIGTARLLGSTDLPDAPIATAIDPDGTAWAITRTGYVGTLTLGFAEVHPSTARRSLRRGGGARGAREAWGGNRQ
ncbi:hypothetical protein [Embleya hyalina]|uniref:WD40 repeat domain-containing protein n=1 Tax=Embleya hyalina TaxID=516124 RepID=A0A401YR12_9ACTN|nr:hypothetical protein [Embleya hyalina]GCD97032.1 hypothetical protein EHYA_04719 [Embleya hyalina]